MKKAPLFGLVALFLVGLLAISAFAMPFGNRGKQGMFGKDSSLKDALEQGDYDVYLDAFEESDLPFLKNKLSEEQFDERVKTHANNSKMKESIEDAIGSEDYDTWKTLVDSLEQKPPCAAKITEDNFDTFVELHKAKKKVKELSEELGLEKQGMHKGSGQGKGMQGRHNGVGQQSGDQGNSQDLGRGMYRGMRQGFGQGMNQGISQ